MIPSHRAVVLLSALGFAWTATAQGNRQAEAYYFYTLARSYESQNQAQKAIESYRKAAELDPGSSETHLALADLYVRLNRLTDAVQAAKQSATIDPKSAAAHRLLGKIYSQMMSGDASDTLAEFAVKELGEATRLEPDDTESLLILAQLHLRRSEVPEAASALESLLRYEPDSYHALYLMAEIRGAEGKTGDAITLLGRALSAEPRFERGYTMLAALYEQQGELDRAVEIYREALEVAPRGSRVPLASALARAGKFDEAAAEFERVLESDRDNEEALFGLALVRRGERSPDRAETLLKRILGKAPDHIAARFALAQVYQDKRLYAEAVSELQALLKAVEASSELPPAAKREQRTKVLVNLGFAHEQVEDYPAAIAAFEKAHREVGGGAPLDAYLAQAYLAGNRLDDAERLVKKSLEKTPDSKILLLLDTQLLQKQGKDGDAIARVEKLREKAPDDLEIIGALADLHRRAGRLSEAERYLSEAAEKAPQNEAVLFQLGAVLERQKKFDAAEQAFKKALAVNPQSGMTLNYLGYMLADRGVRLEESLAYLKDAVALDPYNGSYLDSLGWVYFKMGELDHARDNLLKAIRSLRETGVVYDHLGDVYFRLGNFDDARRYWQKALERNDEDLEKDAVTRKIEELQKKSRELR